MELAPNGVIYAGLFITENSYEMLLNSSKDVLKNKIKHPHVTLEFKPKHLLPNELFHKPFVLTVVGVGCDEYNQGFKIELPEEILPYYKGAAVPHITTSLADGAKAVNTKNLKFESISPFTVRGIVGYFTTKSCPTAFNNNELFSSTGF